MCGYDRPRQQSFGFRLFRDVSLYTQTIMSAAQAPGVLHQAIATAYSGPGVAHLTLPQDLLSESATGEPRSVATLVPQGEITPEAAEQDELLQRIDAADNIVVMCGSGCRGASDLLRQLSSRLKAPLVHSVQPSGVALYG
jgi:thiamine pyrophosphate-dependent acetolactate synthase large subunit-like protein